MDAINWDSQMISIRGPRGVGKTTLMLQYIKMHYPTLSTKVLYCSLDNFFFTNHSLLQLVEDFYKNGGEHIFLDEVHKYENWSLELKQIFDLYPDIKIVLSGSSIINLQKYDLDLARRCVNYNMQGLSFREYLGMYEGINFPLIRFEDLLNNPNNLCAQVLEKCHPLEHFRKYLKYGYFPFYLNRKLDYYTIIEQVTNMIIEMELPMLCNVDRANIRKIKALLKTLATSVPFEVDITKLSKLAELNRNTVIEYLNYLEKAKLIRLLYSDLNSVKKMQKPDKIYLDNTNLLYVLEPSNNQIGTIREIFALNQIGFCHEIEYSKKKGDFRVDGKYILEIGGSRKSFDQIADLPNSFVIADDIELAHGNKIPIWALGFLY